MKLAPRPRWHTGSIRTWRKGDSGGGALPMPSTISLASPALACNAAVAGRRDGCSAPDSRESDTSDICEFCKTYPAKPGSLRRTGKPEACARCYSRSAGAALALERIEESAGPLPHRARTSFNRNAWAEAPMARAAGRPPTWLPGPRLHRARTQNSIMPATPSPLAQTSSPRQTQARGSVPHHLAGKLWPSTRPSNVAKESSANASGGRDISMPPNKCK